MTTKPSAAGRDITKALTCVLRNVNAQTNLAVVASRDPARMVALFIWLARRTFVDQNDPGEVTRFVAAIRPGTGPADFPSREAEALIRLVIGQPSLARFIDRQVDTAKVAESAILEIVRLRYIDTSDMASILAEIDDLSESLSTLFPFLVYAE